MIVYEKDNKLNINFENQLDNPDIEIGKSEIKVDGNNIVSGGTGGGAFVVTFNFNGGTITSDKTHTQIIDAFQSKQFIYAVVVSEGEGTSYKMFYFDGTSSDSDGIFESVSFKSTPSVTSDGVSVHEILVAEDNSIYMASQTYPVDSH